MLGKDYRFVIVNNTGATIQFSTDSANNTFTIKAVGFYIDPSDGRPVFSSEITLFSSPAGSDLSDGASAEGAARDNATDEYVGIKCIAALTTDATTDGTLDIFYEESTDGGTTFPSDAADFNPEEDLIHVASIFTESTNEDRSVNFTIE